MAVAWALSLLCSPRGNLVYLRPYSPNDGILIQSRHIISRLVFAAGVFREGQAVEAFSV